MQPNEQKQEIVKSEPLALYMRKPEVLEKFIGLFPDDKTANRYIQSVLILVQTSEPGDYSLQNCSNLSILRGALRAASLRVSLDPALHQAFLIPRNNRKSGKLEANFQLHYAEIRNRAMRTGRYWFINVSPIYEGCEVFENIYNGLHQVKLANGLMTAPGTQDGFISVSEKRGKVIGWLGYFETTKGAKATAYMSVEDIEKHVSKHNPYWASSFGWKNSRATMEQKTVLLALLKKADLGDPTMDEIKNIVDEDEHESDGPDLAAIDALEGHAVEIKAEAQPIEMSEAEARYVDAGEVLTPKGARLADCTDEVLKVAAKSANHPEVAKAAQERLDYKAAKTAEIERNISDLY